MISISFCGCGLWLLFTNDFFRLILYDVVQMQKLPGGDPIASIGTNPICREQFQLVNGFRASDLIEQGAMFAR
jgi:hypothetical protein